MTVTLGPTLFSFLPAPSSTTKGTLASIVDSTVKGWGEMIAGGGSYHVMAFCDGTNWIVSPGDQIWFSAIIDKYNMMPTQPFNQYDANSGWTFSNAALGATTALAPDGTPNPHKLACDNTNNVHSIACTRIIVGPQVFMPFKLSIFARQDGISTFQLSLVDNLNNANTFTGTYNLNNGSVVSKAATGTFTVNNASILSFNNGWYRCDVDGLASSATGSPFNSQFFVKITLGTGSFAGDGVSGIDLWRLNFMPTHAWDFTKTVFYDDFTSTNTIDLNDTRAPGLNWYVHNLWPGGQAPWTGFTGGVPGSRTQIGDIQVKDSVLTLFNDRSGFGQGLNTICTDGGSGFIGTTFTPPFIYECSMSWYSSQNTDHTQQNQSVAFWTIWSDYLTKGGTPLQSNQVGIEFDFCEAIAFVNVSAPIATNLTHWDFGSPRWLPGDAQQNKSGWGANSYQNLVTNKNFTPFTRVTGMWITQAQNALSGGSYGYILNFIDGVFTSIDTAYSATAVPSPGGNPVTFTGMFAVGESQKFPIIIGAGCKNGQNAGINPVWGKWDWVAVYQ